MGWTAKASSLALAILVATTLAGRSARAQAPAAGNAADAETRRTSLYRAGVDAASAGRWAEAKSLFEATLAIRSSAKVLFSLGQAEEQLGHVARAGIAYAGALDAAKAANEREVVAAATQALATVMARVPSLRVIVTGVPASSATATLDGAPIAIGDAVPVDPGTHRLVVTAPGAPRSETSVTLHESQTQTETVALATTAPPIPPAPAVGAPAPPPPPAEPATASEAPGPASGIGPWRTNAIVAASAGVVGIGVGIFLGVRAKSENDQSYAMGCGGASGNACPTAAAQERRDALSMASASTVAFVAGGVLAAGGLALWIVAPRPQADTGVSVTPVALGSGGGAVLTGTWR